MRTATSEDPSTRFPSIARRFEVRGLDGGSIVRASVRRSLLAWAVHAWSAVASWARGDGGVAVATFRQRESKQSDDGTLVSLYQDVHDGSWFVGRRGDRSLDPMPLGGFASMEAARRWADAQFRGGTWHADQGARYHV